MHRERQRMQHQAARGSKIVDHLERIALIENMLARAMIGGEAIFPAAVRWHRVEIQVESQRSEIAVDVHAVVFEPKTSMQMSRWSKSGTRVADVDVKL